MEKFFSENKVETPQWRRIPVTVEIDGKKENIWVNYIVEMIPKIGKCVECGSENQEMLCESVKEVKVESDNKEAARKAKDMIIELVKRCEQKMFVCKNCLTDNFLKRRAQLYAEALEETQEELGIEIDEKEQRNKILGKS